VLFTSKDGTKAVTLQASLPGSQSARRREQKRQEMKRREKKNYMRAPQLSLSNGRWQKS
jgi:hypothetical protein